MSATRDQPDQTYRPSAKIRLDVRFEEYGQDTGVPVPRKPPQLRRGSNTEKADLEPTLVNGVLTLVNKSAPNAANNVGTAQATSSDNRSWPIEGVIPKSASLAVAGLQSAGTLEVEFLYSDFPFDARVIRACAVEFYLGTVTAEEFELGQNGVTRGDYFGGGVPNAKQPLNLVPDTYIDVYGRTRTNLRFQGWVDQWEQEWPDGAEPTVRLVCRDNLALLIDQEAPPQLTISVKEPLDLAIAHYLANFPACRGLGVQFLPANATPPVLGALLSKTAKGPNGGPPPGKGGGAASKMSAWQYITDVVGSCGLIARLEGTTIIIQRARTLYANKFTGRPADPFKGRLIQPNNVLIQRRLFLYGRNVKDLTFVRKFTKNKPSNVQVISYLGARKKPLMAWFPSEKDRKALDLQPGDKGDQKWNVVRINSIQDLPTLRVIAQNTYEQLSRQELGVKLTTMNLGSFGGFNLDPDVLDMQQGDAFDVDINRDLDDLSTTTRISDIQADPQRHKEFLISLGYSQELATAYSDAFSNIGFQKTFRVRGVSYSWDIESGVEIEIEGVNYIEVRASQNLPAGEEQEPPDVPDLEPVTVDVTEPEVF